MTLDLQALTMRVANIAAGLTMPAPRKPTRSRKPKKSKAETKLLRQVEHLLNIIAKQAVHVHGDDVAGAYYEFESSAYRLAHTEYGLTLPDYLTVCDQVWAARLDKIERVAAREALNLTRRQARLERERAKAERLAATENEFAALEARDAAFIEQPGRNAVAGTRLGRVLASRPVNRMAARVTSKAA